MPPPARLLDVTRLVSRAGRVLTGVDRVEAAYLDASVADSVPVRGLCRTALGYVLLDEDGLRAVAAARVEGWGRPDLLSRLTPRLDPDRKAGQSLVRRHAVARARRGGLEALLRDRLPDDVSYLSVGLSNLDAVVFDAVKALPGARIAVMIHDTIPLDLPGMQRAGTAERFAATLSRVASRADLILCPSHSARADLRRHVGDAPRIEAVHLGVLPGEPGRIPAGTVSNRPYFVALGTIEPRKNHALLLDLWEREAPEADLIVCGTRGWNNEDVFARLDAGIAGVREVAGLDDGAVAALLSGSRGLLFPSLAEGFGLPMAEAAALGVPVVCGDLAVCREVLGGVGVYASTSDPYAWRRAIRALLDGETGGAGRGYVPPSWSDHFKTVLSMA